MDGVRIEFFKRVRQCAWTQKSQPVDFNNNDQPERGLIAVNVEEETSG